MGFKAMTNRYLLARIVTIADNGPEAVKILQGAWSPLSLLSQLLPPGAVYGTSFSYLPGVSVAVRLGCNGVHDVLLALNALLPPLNLLNVLLPLVLSQLLIPLPEHFAVCSHLQTSNLLVKTLISGGCLAAVEACNANFHMPCQ